MTSLSGFDWHHPIYDERAALTISQRYDIPLLVAQICTARGYTLENIEQFLTPKLRDTLPNPFHLHDMDKAVDTLLHAIDTNQSITIFGDYDVDGATSTAVLMHYFRHLGIEAGHYIPDRTTEGYGPNANAMKKLAAQGTNLVITVDCGATAHEALQTAKEHGQSELANVRFPLNLDRLIGYTTKWQVKSTF